MTISDYRKKLLAETKDSSASIGASTKKLLSLAGDQEKIGALIKVISDGSSSPSERGAAIDALNTVSNFSPALRTKMSEFVNALRGQMSSGDEAIRLRVFGTLTAMKDEVAQGRLVADLESEKPEASRLVPTAQALAMLGKDEKALPPPLLLKIAENPPDKDSLIQAVRHMSANVKSLPVLEKVLRDDDSPPEARAMIPQMINKIDPQAFLNTAKDLLKKGASPELATALTRGVAELKQLDPGPEFNEATEAVRDVMKTSPPAFKNLANKLLFNKKGDSEE